MHFFVSSEQVTSLKQKDGGREVGVLVEARSVEAGRLKIGKPQND